jgi:hypothetical protein
LKVLSPLIPGLLVDGKWVEVRVVDPIAVVPFCGLSLGAILADLQSEIVKGIGAGCFRQLIFPFDTVALNTGDDVSV